MNIYAQQTRFYVTGGTIHRDAACYVQRQADQELLDGLTRGDFCYVLTARQMGKSSLMVRTAVRLREEGATVAVLDLTALGQNLTAEQWYDGLLMLIGQQLNIEEPLEVFWFENARFSPLQRWMRAIKEIVLPQCSGRLVIFIDEIDAVRSLPFSTDEFFAAIRQLYNERTENPELYKLTFCLLGVASPSDLIQDTRTTPFNIGQRVELSDFTEYEAAPLTQGLGREKNLAESVLHRVLYWTGGHPYLTQRLCLELAEDSSVDNTKGVDRVCEELFLSTRARERDDNLLFVRERLLRSEADLANLLDMYKKVRGGKRVADDETNQSVDILRLSGIVRVVDGWLRVRNRIYEHVFNREWVIANMPDAELRRQRAAYHKGLIRAAAAAAAILILVSGLAFAAIQQRNRAVAALAKAEEEKLRADENAQKALLALAKVEEEKRRADANADEALRNLGEADKQRKQAENQRQAAVKQQAIAEEQRQRAVEQQRIAENQQQTNRRLLYVSQMNLAHNTWETGAGSRLEQLLKDQISKPGEEDLRGIEWHYLWGLSHSGLHTFQHADTVSYVEFSPDGQTLSTRYGDEEGKKVWDITSGEERMSLKYPDEGANRRRISPDGKVLMTTSDDRKDLKLWDVETGRELFSIDVPKGGSRWAVMEFSPDCKTVLTSIGFTGLKLWDIATRKVLRTFETFAPMSQNSVAFSPDGQMIAASVLQGGPEIKYILALFDVKTGDKINLFADFSRVVYPAKFSPDGQKLLTYEFEGDEMLAKVWNVTTRQNVSVLKGLGSSPIITFSPNSKVLVVGNANGAIKIWDVTTGQEIATLEGHKEEITQVQFSPGSKEFASGGYDGSVKLWDVNTKQELAVFKGHAGPITSLSFSQDGKKLVTGSADRTAKVWDVPVRNELSFASQRTYNSSLKFSPDLKKLATGDIFFGTWHIWDVMTGHERADFQDRSGCLSNSIASFAFSMDGKRLVTGNRCGTARLWDLSTGKEVKSFVNPGTRISDNSNSIGSVAISRNSERIATGEANGTIRIWDVETGQQLGTLEGHSEVVHGLAFSPDGRKLASASLDKKVKLWDITTLQELFVITDGRGIMIALDFTADGRRLATGYADNTVRIWDIANKKEALALIGHNRLVTALSFSPDGRRLATGSFDRTVRLWDVATGRELVALRGFKQSIATVAFSTDGSTLGIAEDDGTIRVIGAGIDRMIRLEPDYATYHQTLARELENQGKLSEAEKEYREAIRSQPNSAQYHIFLGFNLTRQGKNEEAESEIREAIKLQPENARWQYSLGTSLSAQYKDREAVAAYREAVRLDPDLAGAYSDIGVILALQKKYGEAEVEFQRALKLEPTLAYALCFLGYFRIERNYQIDESLKLIEQAVKAEPNNAFFIGCLGFAYLKLGQLEQAERYLTKASRESAIPEISERIQARIQEHLGDLYKQQEKRDLAQTAWQKALTLTGDEEQKKRLTEKLASIK